ncbi:hypothetical protein D1007_08231 [Hordeum vulgare]|nr:hypothetical protein D1007_08231 [Hordeum vulgare]
MVERFLSNGVAANGFGRRHLHEEEARLLYEADYPVPPDMRVPGSSRLSIDGVPVPLPPSQADRWVEIMGIRSSVPESSHNLPRYAPDSNTFWTTYFERGTLTSSRHQRGRSTRLPQLRGAPPMVGHPSTNIGGHPRAHRR